MNQEILKEITEQDYASITKSIQDFIKKQIKESNSEGIVLGLSGGIDSTVIAYLCSNELKSKTLTLVMPDSKISPKSETEDALNTIEKLELQYKLLDVNLIHSSFSKYLEPNDRGLSNLRARIRANVLYYYANAKNRLVIGSSDKSEYLIGYFTKFGDGSADLLPIVNLYKTQVRELAKHLGVPESIISKKSSPHLWKNHIAEDEIGAKYEEIDSILFCMIDKKLSLDETIKATEIERAVVEKIYQLYKNSQHKRITAPKPQINYENT